MGEPNPTATCGNDHAHVDQPPAVVLGVVGGLPQPVGYGGNGGVIGVASHRHYEGAVRAGQPGPYGSNDLFYLGPLGLVDRHSSVFDTDLCRLLALEGRPPAVIAKELDRVGVSF